MCHRVLSEHCKILSGQSALQIRSLSLSSVLSTEVLLSALKWAASLSWQPSQVSLLFIVVSQTAHQAREAVCWTHPPSHDGATEQQSGWEPTELSRILYCWQPLAQRCCPFREIIEQFVFYPVASTFMSEKRVCGCSDSSRIQAWVWKTSSVCR